MMPTGSNGLDRLLGGGLRTGSITLVDGPAFLGKEALARGAAMANLAADVPVLWITTRRCAQDIEADLPLLDGATPPSFIDTYSAAVGADEPAHNITYVDATTDLNGLAAAVREHHARLAGHEGPHLLVVDSVSTLVLHVGAAPAFRFLQVLLGRSRRAGATTLLTLDAGMHPESEREMLRHLCDAAIELRRDRERNQVRVQGRAVGGGEWIDYQVGASGFQVTGSLAAGRIH
ncbi:MAG: RAD55 family ATPase [Thermoplasmatota archaeon]